jgi:glycosyltransferase involved in cell wall biosynthesis
MDNALKSGVIGNFFLAREGVPIPAKRIKAYPGKDSALLILFNPKSIQNILNIKKFFYDYWIYAAGDQRIATTCLRVTGVSTEELAELIDLDVSKLNQLRVKGIGYIDDLSSLFQDSIALVSPTFIGGGIRKKILEAMANQIPVIATPLDVKVSNFFSPGRNILVMHDVDSFCDSVSTLKVNPSYLVE